MDTKQNIPKQTVTRLRQAPNAAVHGHLGDIPYTASIAITDYGRKIADHYADQIGAGGLAGICGRAAIPFNFPSFGMIVEFEKPIELQFYDADLVLDETLKDAIGRFGPLIFRNAYMAAKFRGEGQRNIFPDLNFHVDRGSHQDNQYSLFCRDPFDPVQKAPRESSTLILANIVAHLQSMKEGQDPESGAKTLYYIFKDEDLEPLIGGILLEQPWTAPGGTGEICVFDNRTLQHASYYRAGRGYPIGVRYLF